MEFSTPAEEARIRSEWVRQIKSLQDSCHATFINADWAFNANTQTGSEIHGKSPLWTLKMVEDGCTYHPAGDSLTISPNLDFAVLFHLDAGQEHNADARFHYRQCLLAARCQRCIDSRCPQSLGRFATHGKSRGEEILRDHGDVLSPVRATP
jgi:hypothetical protein